MNKNIITKTLFSILVLVLMISTVSAVPANIVGSVKIDDQVLTSGSTVRLNVERDQEFEVRLALLSADALTNVEVSAFVSGYEHNDVERVFDATPVFDMAANVTYTKRLMLKLPSDANTDSYKLRIVVSDRNSDSVVQNYDLRLDAPRHLLRIDDVNVFSGGNQNQVVSGDPVLVNARIKNLGDRAEEDIKVKVSIPQLGLSGTKYIDNIRTDKSEETGNMYMKLPKCVEPGNYQLNVEAFYNNYKKTATDNTQSLTVLKNEACDKKEEDRKVVVVEIQQPPKVTETTTSMDNNNESESTISKVRSVLEIFLVVLFAIFIVIGIVVFFSRLMKNPDDEE